MKANDRLLMTYRVLRGYAEDSEVRALWLETPPTAANALVLQEAAQKLALLMTEESSGTFEHVSRFFADVEVHVVTSVLHMREAEPEDITRRAYDARCEEIKRYNTAWLEKQERDEYARLRAKFEPPVDDGAGSADSTSAAGAVARGLAGAAGAKIGRAHV